MLCGISPRKKPDLYILRFCLILFCILFYGVILYFRAHYNPLKWFNGIFALNTVLLIKLNNYTFFLYFTGAFQ